MFVPKLTVTIATRNMLSPKEVEIVGNAAVRIMDMAWPEIGKDYVIAFGTSDQIPSDDRMLFLLLLERIALDDESRVEKFRKALAEMSPIAGKYSAEFDWDSKAQA